MALQSIAPAGWAEAFSNVRGRTTTNELAASFKPVHFENLVRWDADDDGDGKGTVSRGQDLSPLITLTTFLGDKSETISHYRFEIWEQRPARDFVIVSAAGAAYNATTVPLIDGDAARLSEGVVLYYPATQERMRIPWRSTDIDTTTGANQITNLSRGLENNGVGKAIPAGAKLLILSASRPEGAQDGTPQGYKDETDYNYCQEMSASIAITERNKVIKQWSGRDWAMAKKEGQRDFRRRHQFVPKQSQIFWSHPQSSYRPASMFGSRLHDGHEDVSGVLRKRLPRRQRVVHQLRVRSIRPLCLNHNPLAVFEIDDI